MFKTRVLPGDVNGDGKVDLMDAILALKVLSKTDTGGAVIHSDVNGDGRAGIEEVIYVLQRVI